MAGVGRQGAEGAGGGAEGQGGQGIRARRGGERARTGGSGQRGQGRGGAARRMFCSRLWCQGLRLAGGWGSRAGG